MPCEVIDDIAILDANDQSSTLGTKELVLVTNFEESMLSVGDTRD